MTQTPRARLLGGRAVAADVLDRRFSMEGLEPRTLLANVPVGFTDAQVAAGLNNPTAMALAPDGRIFVAEKNGAVRIIKNNQLLSQPFANVSVETFAQRGLGGIVLDPNFTSNGFVYVYYTASQPNIHNRIARFTASGDVAVSNSHVVLLDLPEIGGAINHMGGALHFGADGKLYAAIGDHDRGNDATTLQSIHNVWGKMLRLNKDGSIPTDNPFYNQTSGINRAVWAYGLRNPFTAAVQPGTGRIFINDVGELSWEEINEGIAGANYGWPVSEGPTSNPNFVAPFHAYPTSQGCAITGGDFYNPQVNQFPPEYQGKYFFADLCGGWIRALDLNTRQSTTFATSVNQPVDIDVAPDGTLYYLQRGNGSVRKVTYASTAAPAITQHPSNVTVDVGQPATFSVTATGAAPLNYQWQRRSAGSADFVNVGANSSSYTINATTASDHNALFRVVVSNTAGSLTSNSATLAVITDPSATVYLSDVNPTFASNGWGPYERDMSNGEAGAGDGAPITLNGVVYAKGLGVHAYSELRYNLAGLNASRFVSDIGVDDYVGSAGSVVFQVWTDGTKIFDSGTMTGASATQSVDVNIAGRNELRLIVTDAGNGNANDHADWADARLARAGLSVMQSGFHFATAPHRLTFQFNTNVAASLSTSDLVLQNLTTNTTVPAGNIALSYNTSSNTATFTFPGFTSGLLPDARFRATLSGSGITDPGGTPMGTDHVFSFLFLRGDANNDGRVNLQDFNRLAANFGQSPRDFTQGDFNYDGVVNLADFNILAARFGASLGSTFTASLFEREFGQVLIGSSPKDSDGGSLAGVVDELLQ